MTSVGGGGDDADMEEVVGVAEVFAEPLQRSLQERLDTVDHHLVTLRLTWVEREKENWLTIMCHIKNDFNIKNKKIYDGSKDQRERVIWREDHEREDTNKRRKGRDDRKQNGKEKNRKEEARIKRKER